MIRFCRSTVYSGDFKLLRKQDLYKEEGRMLVKMCHLRDDLFLFAFAPNFIEIWNMADNSVVSSLELEENDEISDMDFYKDERKVILSMRSYSFVKVNMANQTYSVLPHNSQLNATQLFFLKEDAKLRNLEEPSFVIV